MIKEKFGDYYIVYGMRDYWNLYEPVVVEVWPAKGSLVELSIKQQFIDYVLER